MNAFSTAAVLMVLAAAAVPVTAQTQEQPSPASCILKFEAMKDAAASTTFAATAAQDGMIEVALAGLALRKSRSNQLRQFAQRVVQDYARSNGELDSIARCKGLILPTEVDAKHTALVVSFNAKSGSAFDEAYLKHMGRKHSEATTLFESASRSGDPDVVAFARKGLSTLREHQVLADNLRAGVGAEVVSTH